jgi:hypothetical protein
MGRIKQIPVRGSSGDAPTGALQFQDDWPGLFIRGDEAMGLVIVIEYLKEKLKDHPDASVASALKVLSRYVTIINEDVIVRPTK